MSKYRDRIDDIFKSLYGSDSDEDGLSYKENYYDESLSMEDDYIEYLRCMDLFDLSPCIEDVAKFIVYTEYVHIGNDHYVRNNLDLKTLKEIVADLLKENSI